MAAISELMCDLCTVFRKPLSSYCGEKSMKNMPLSVQFIFASLSAISIAFLASFLTSVVWRNQKQTQITTLSLKGNEYNFLAVLPELKKNHVEPDLLQGEGLAALKHAIQMKREGKREKAKKLFKQALHLAPHHADILIHYGEFLEEDDEFVQAEHLYSRALASWPGHNIALANKRRTLPKVQEIDRATLDRIDEKREQLLLVRRGNLALTRAMREAYFQHIYHSNAIEGNTMTLSMTRAIVETRMAVPGKSILEHNEVIGLDEALKFVNSTLVQKMGKINVDDILTIHKHVLGYAHPFEAGRYRDTQVYVSDYVPPHPTLVQKLMMEFNEWLQSPDTDLLHPIEYAALAHYKLVYIHPFTDGNGRTARLLMNSILMQAGFPPVIIQVQDRHDYYEHLNTANQGDIRPFIRFVASCTERTIDEYLSATAIYPVDKHVVFKQIDDSSHHYEDLMGS